MSIAFRSLPENAIKIICYFIDCEATVTMRKVFLRRKWMNSIAVVNSI